jgi:hypothetical protein
LITDQPTLASLADEITTMKWFKKPAGLTTGVPDRAAANAAHIKATLDRLKQKAES